MHRNNVMRCTRGLLCSGMALGAALALMSCDKASRSTANAPVIEIETEHFDFGGIESDAIAEDFVRVYNRGKSDLIITQVITECYCTEGEMLEQVIPAGGEGVLRITVDPSRIRGPASSKTLLLLSNDPETPAAEIKVSATFLPGLVWEPKRLDFGEIPQGQGAEARVRIRQKQNTPLTIIQDVTGGNRYMVGEYVEIPPEERAAPDKVEYDLIVRVLPETPVGAQALNFVLTTSARDGKVTFMAVAHIVPSGGETSAGDAASPTDD